jgi:hypothetical protein
MSGRHGWLIEPLLTLATQTRIAYIIHSLLSPEH